ncbi:MAG: RluA family pseudouridine synthase [Myxococcales bacterium]|nr:RluA family pseudouridine synthase [Myxococcales bacterium]USN49833.1 MAG: RluA family pseudouridine synthase [Myxococcales bacterium]
MQTKLIVLQQGPHHVAVFKPHNIAVVGGPGVVRPTLLDLVRDRFGKSIYAVHRLDRVTSGITLFARSIFAKHALENAFKKRLVHKTYWAIVEGKPEFKKITVDKKLKRFDAKGKKTRPMAFQTISDEGESALTHFNVLKQINEKFCLIEAQPITGRTHQIRVHLQYLGHPIVGDKLYGATSLCAPHTIALCAVGLDFPLPKGKKESIDARKLFEIKNYIEY